MGVGAGGAIVEEVPSAVSIFCLMPRSKAWRFFLKLFISNYIHSIDETLDDDNNNLRSHFWRKLARAKSGGRVPGGGTRGLRRPWRHGSRVQSGRPKLEWGRVRLTRCDRLVGRHVRSMACAVCHARSMATGLTPCGRPASSSSARDAAAGRRRRSSS